MATPSSSATSPSPPMPYLHHGVSTQQASVPPELDSEQERRSKAVKKFLARAEVAMVTRALRARLAYASYKATHNVPHVPIRDLEAQSQGQTASFNRTIVAKRKAVGAPNYYSNPATQGPSSAGAGSLRRGGPGTMAPPASVSSPRTHPPPVIGIPGYSSYNEAASSMRNTSQAPSLYSSILAPPPTNKARTIHNPSDPPIPAPSRPAPSPRLRAQKASPRTETPRSQPKAKQTIKAAKLPASPDRRRTKGGSIDKGKRKQDISVDGDADVDMKAAAALTSLLMNHRPSVAGSASSPKSSTGSEVGSAYSYSHFAQSSARTAVPLSAAPSSSNVAAESENRIRTPPPSGSTQKQTTPRAAPTDSEAANLMLFLATSPSPARPANKESRDMAAYRALGGGTGPLRSKGRVLFPSSAAPDPGPSGREGVAAASGGTLYRPPALTRGGDASFASSISSIGGELGDVTQSVTSDGHSSQSSAGAAPSGSSSGSVVSQLLPPALLPLPSAPTNPVGRNDATSNPRPNPAGVASGTNTAVPLDFNIHEFINASPSSPSRITHGTGSAGNHKANLGLRADVGRKLFEEEQLRHHHALQNAAAAAAGGPNQRQEDRSLGAGIDLIHS
ncbi:hypothetical protein CVT25_014519 [Psilocybe cyanescens]|uniref:Uncharacterized protein n=1 Tax=Psilocybe cyanescens TaxID=93625 RepID=A0A409WRA2_PSICY|nr:hypothetical protein CVT25_014519 [Psilocybe cyanescens]